MKPQISNPVPELDDQFEQDWKQASDRYQAGVKAGYSEEDAQSLYLDPVRAKWSVVAKSPEIAQDPKKFNQFNSETNAATDNFQKNYYQYSRDGGDWAATRPDSIAPVLNKWTIESSLPIKKEKPLTEAENKSVEGLPEKVLREAKAENIIPINPATQGLDANGSPTKEGKPFALTIPQTLSNDLKSKNAELLTAGVDPVMANRWARGLTLGTNWTIAPNVTTNAPAVPADNSHTILRWKNTPAIPADISTNSFSVKPGGLDQEAVKAAGSRFGIQPVNPQAKSPLPDFGAVAPKTNEVTRVTKDGRKAIFDSQTKKFLRYGE